MYQKATRILFIFLLMLSTQAASAQSKQPAYQYMQLFYYGASPLSGPIGTFSPALRGQADIMLTEPTDYMKGVTAMVSGGNSGGSQQAVPITEITAPGMMTPAQRKQEEAQAKQRQLESQQGMEKYARMMADHKKAHLEKITQSLNTAAAEGWEVVQMSSFGADGLVYLLRKAK